MHVLCLYCKHKGIEESVLRVFTHERQVLFLSAKLGRQSLRFRAAKTFFFGIPVFLYQDGNPVHHMIHWRQFCPSLISEGKEGRSPVKLRKPKFFFFRDVTVWCQCIGTERRDKAVFCDSARRCDRPERFAKR